MQRSIGAIALFAAMSLSVISFAAEPEPPPQLPAPKSPLELRDGERIALVGGTFVERLQTYGYLETLLTAAHPDRHIVFRNLGWSGDTVWGESRAVFGGASDGFQRLLKDLAQTRPTLIVVAYGANEASAGEAGLEEFRKGLAKLLGELEKICPRIVLLSPLKRENLDAPLPDHKAYNLALSKYTAVVEATAKERGLVFEDVAELVDLVATKLQLTDNGVHLSEFGHWRTAPLIAISLDAKLPRWRIETDVGDEKVAGVGMTLKEITPTALGLRFVVLDDQLPYPAAPPHSLNSKSFMPPRHLQISGLPAGKYEVQIDGDLVLTTDAEALAKGVQITRGPQFDQAAALQAAIAEKNEFFFHRHRPQNETYLFLFRKGEQGNNAVEIPQFDPLIEEKEKEIAALRVPQPHEFRIIQLESK